MAEHRLSLAVNGRDLASPLIEQAMKSIALRPERVIERAGEVMAAEGRPLGGARVIVIGVSYKALARDDLRPFGLMCARMTWWGITRRSSSSQPGASQRSTSQPGAAQSRARGPSALLRAAGGPRYRPGPRATRDRTGPRKAQFGNEGEKA